MQFGMPNLFFSLKMYQREVFVLEQQNKNFSMLQN